MLYAPRARFSFSFRVPSSLPVLKDARDDVGMKLGFAVIRSLSIPLVADHWGTSDGRCFFLPPFPLIASPISAGLTFGIRRRVTVLTKSSSPVVVVVVVPYRSIYPCDSSSSSSNAGGSDNRIERLSCWFSY